MRRDGCKKADIELGHESSCLSCPFPEPMCLGWAEVRSSALVLKLWYQGKTTQEIQAQTGVSERTIKRYLRDLFPITKGLRWKAWRDRVIKYKYRNGKSVEDLARIFRLSEAEIYRIAKAPDHYQKYQDTPVHLYSKIPIKEIEPTIKKHPELAPFLCFALAQEHMRRVMEIDPFGITIEDKDIQSLIDALSPRLHIPESHQ